MVEPPNLYDSSIILSELFNILISCFFVIKFDGLDGSIFSSQRTSLTYMFPNPTNNV